MVSVVVTVTDSICDEVTIVPSERVAFTPPTLVSAEAVVSASPSDSKYTVNVIVSPERLR